MHLKSIQDSRSEGRESSRTREEPGLQKKGKITKGESGRVPVMSQNTYQLSNVIHLHYHPSCYIHCYAVIHRQGWIIIENLDTKPDV